MAQTFELNASVASWVETNLLKPTVTMKFLHLRSKRRMSGTDPQTLSAFGLRNGDVVIMVLDDISDEAAVELARSRDIPDNRSSRRMQDFVSKYIPELIVAIAGAVIAGLVLWKIF